MQSINESINQSDDQLGAKSTNQSVLKSLLAVDQFLLGLADVVNFSDLCSVCIELP